jgi:hypothetical protein
MLKNYISRFFFFNKPSVFTQNVMIILLPHQIIRDRLFTI